MPDYLSILVAGQPVASVAKASSLLLLPPVTAILPGTGLVPVAMVCPFAELDVDLVIYSAKDTLGYTCSIVSRPTPNDRVEGRYESRLWSTSVLSDDTSYLV